MIAINKFKGLISKSRVGTPDAGTPRTTKKMEIPEGVREAPADTTATATQDKPKPEARPRHKSIAEEAAELIEARKAYLASTDNTTKRSESELGRIQELTSTEPQYLGIGTGGHDGFVASAPHADIVSDSPTGIDFDVYDRAFEAEVERIRSEKRGSQKTTYLTRFVGEKEKYFGDESMILEAGRSIPAAAASGMSKASSAAVRTLANIGFTHRDGSDGGSEEGNRREQLREKFQAKRVETQDNVQGIKDKGKEKGHKFAELVMGTIQGTKPKASE
jgi:[calcium/calmodulin-dependent protein kinase] kinase